ncbi:TonB-dependent receptor [Sphingobium jiangsuense]|uniref:Iron complex outermembrane receptor protein n=1 Tax=Sphingobium jiangsuense TaxID=870476 RepID=A0A7W6BM65_9SPHN|nr:TonB-dependent receptor [Sphingobium jiangsuense]MBB3926380.1 iron complex outermembrane receptor protein [Sphingobium jiangsuense]GLS99078.1 TonB-dependent receptor [Sphingobium jiangsuense]SCW95545.1 iron complex outermembrane recepter protein [Sphingobium faniae]
MLVVAAFGAGAAAAQTADTQTVEALAESQNAQSESGLQDIVVTAQRRSESAQTVPISVAAFSAESLAASGTKATTDLSSLVTGLTVTPVGARQPLYLRGVGNSNIAASPAVLLFVDGVYQPFNIGSQSFSDIASIEVAKGPQGTLFGRNATGGVIQVATRDPSSDPTGEFQIGYGNYDTLSGKAYLAGALTSSVRASLAGFYENQSDGWGRSIATGEDIFKSKSVGVRGKVVIDVSDLTSITLAADYTYSRGNSGSAVAQAIGGTGFLFDYVSGTKYSLSPYDVNANYTPLYTSKEGGASITVKSEVGAVDLLSITSWRKNRSYTQVDYDGSAAPFFDLSRHDESTAVTQEFQAKSQGDSKLSWVAGLFYYHNDSTLTPFRFGGVGATAVFGAPLGSPYDIFAFDTVNAYAAYAQATAEIFPDTRLTLGARYTIEKHEQNGYVEAGSVVPGTTGRQSKTFRKPSFRASLDHRFGRDLMIYASYNRSFNAGYFNTASVGGFTAAANPGVKPETIDAYEVGFKSELFDRHVRFNLSAFRYDYANLQQQIFRNGALATVNAASARIQGVDAEVQVRLLGKLDIALSAEYLDPKYESYPDGPMYSYAPIGALILSSGDAKGYSTPNAPHFSFNASVNYAILSDIGRFNASASLNYRGDTYGDSFERFKLKNRYLANASLKWTSLDDKTSVTLWGKNLFNEIYDEAYSMLDPVGPAGTPGAPRTYGVTIGRNF